MNRKPVTVRAWLVFAGLSVIFAAAVLLAPAAGGTTNNSSTIVQNGGGHCDTQGRAQVRFAIRPKVQPQPTVTVTGDLVLQNVSHAPNAWIVHAISPGVFTAESGTVTVTWSHGGATNSATVSFTVSNRNLCQTPPPPPEPTCETDPSLCPPPPVEPTAQVISMDCKEVVFGWENYEGILTVLVSDGESLLLDTSYTTTGPSGQAAVLFGFEGSGELTATVGTTHGSTSMSQALDCAVAPPAPPVLEPPVTVERPAMPATPAPPVTAEPPAELAETGASVAYAAFGALSTMAGLACIAYGRGRKLLRGLR
jgi:hypothetical protein